MSLAAKDSRHGTANGYNNHLCRCRRCRRAWATYCRDKGYARTPTAAATRRAKYDLARANGYPAAAARRRQFWSDPLAVVGDAASQPGADRV